MITFRLRCPNCEDIQDLILPYRENFQGQIIPGKPVRIELTCQKCQTNFLLQATLSQIVEEGK